MKKMYETPAVEITAIAAEDIITASGGYDENKVSIIDSPDIKFTTDSGKQIVRFD